MITARKSGAKECVHVESTAFGFLSSSRTFVDVDLS